MLKLVMLNKEAEEALRGPKNYTDEEVSELIMLSMDIKILAEAMEEWADNHEDDTPTCTSTCSIGFSLIALLMDPIDDFVNKSFSLNQKNRGESGET
ncbi:hypothetical protein AGMMS49991_04650 [Spirochaetia bacterium]|nr:hypothetical protein AGMMS49991_04650 [Spirochaetia bacterium]